MANIKQVVVRGIRGATTAASNTAEDIISVTGELLQEMLRENGVDIRDIAGVLLSATPDLNQAFPAKAARRLGWLDVPLFCHVEIDVPDSLVLCIRVLMFVNTEQDQNQIKHVYLNGTAILREQ
ncbi:MAG TPA: chorismate mutase [Candidatus Limnocylindrales bacterium]|nr:chorismate mutase [Candidatus Limnocylindrales bacterium]